MRLTRSGAALPPCLRDCRWLVGQRPPPTGLLIRGCIHVLHLGVRRVVSARASGGGLTAPTLPRVAQALVEKITDRLRPRGAVRARTTPRVERRNLILGEANRDWLGIDRTRRPTSPFFFHGN